MKQSDNIIKYTTQTLIETDGYASWVEANTDTSKNTTEIIGSEQVVDGYTYTISWTDETNNKSGVFTLTTGKSKGGWVEDEDDNCAHYVSGDEIISSKVQVGRPPLILKVVYSNDSSLYFEMADTASSYNIGESYSSRTVVFEVTDITEIYATINTYEVTLAYDSDETSLPIGVFTEQPIMTFEVHSDIITDIPDAETVGRDEISTFTNCFLLESAVIDIENFEKIGAKGFYDSGLTELTLYSTAVPTIGEDAFDSLTPPQPVGEDAFGSSTPLQPVGEDTIGSMTISERTLYVPEESLELYQESDFANYFTTILPIPVPPVPPAPRCGFNLSGMRDTDYVRQY